MRSFLRELNRWDLNLILTIIGFPFFTMLISNSVASIIYRGFALLISLACIKKSYLYIPRSFIARAFLFVVLYVSIQAIIGVFFTDYALYEFSGVKYQFLLFNIGITWLPLLAFVTGFEQINWEKSMFVIFVLLLITLINSDLRTYEVSAVNGRYDMGRLSTLAFGDNGGYLVLLALSLIVTRQEWNFNRKNSTIVLLIFAVLVGMFGALKAGSRGPVVGMSFGILFILFCMHRKQRIILLSTLLILGCSGVISIAALKNFAPGLYYRFMMTIENGDTSGRDVLFEESLQKFQESPVFGSNPITLSPTQFSSCHSVYMEVLQGGGLFIFALYGLCLISIILFSLKYKNQIRENVGILFLFCLFYFNLGRGLSGIMLVSNAIYAFAFVGCALAIYHFKYTNLFNNFDNEYID